MWRFFAPLLGAVLLLVLPAAHAQDNAPAGDAGRGKQLFTADGCYECHGYIGQGGAAGPRIAPMALPFEAFQTQLRTPANEMPPYTAAALPDKDVTDLYAYMRSIPAPQHAAKDIPLLNR